jgi:hypothetical protein
VKKTLTLTTITMIALILATIFVSPSLLAFAAGSSGGGEDSGGNNNDDQKKTTTTNDDSKTTQHDDIHCSGGACVQVYFPFIIPLLSLLHITLYADGNV